MSNNQLVEWSEMPSLRELRDRVDHLDISADAKVLLMRIGETSMDIGGRIVAVGRRIVAFALNLLRQFPNMAFCLLVAFVISSLVASVPLLGPLLALFVNPLITAVSVAGGALLEIKDGDLRGRVDLLVTEFEQIFA